MKETAPERTASDLPEKDNMNGKKEAIAPLVKKKNPAVVSPEKPILPDLYQEKFL